MNTEKSDARRGEGHCRDIMRAIFSVCGVLLFCSGCSTIVMHSQDDPLDRKEARGVYSGVRLDTGLLADKTKAGQQHHRILVMCYSCADFPFSIVADTFCLPVDLFYHPPEAPPKTAPPKTAAASANDSTLHATAETSAISNH